MEAQGVEWWKVGELGRMFFFSELNEKISFEAVGRGGEEVEEV